VRLCAFGLPKSTDNDRVSRNFQKFRVPRLLSQEDAASQYRGLRGQGDQCQRKHDDASDTGAMLTNEAASEPFCAIRWRKTNLSELIGSSPNIGELLMIFWIRFSHRISLIERPTGSDLHRWQSEHRHSGVTADSKTTCPVAKKIGCTTPLPIPADCLPIAEGE